jgi:xanthine/uracil permease
MRGFTPIILLVIFAGWILYRLLVKKDLKQHINSLYAGLFFVGIWTAIYFLWLK